MKTAYIIGPPGAGKSTLAAELRKGWSLVGKREHPFKHQLYSSPFGPSISLGWDRKGFAGTDTLGFDCIVSIEKWLPTCNASLVFGEGDRLANSRFFELAKAHGQLFLFYLNPPLDVVQARRAARAAKLGAAEQNDAWARGRATKHERLAKDHGAITIEPTLTPQQAVAFMEAKLREGP